MAYNAWVRAAGVSGACAVGLGAIGAHALRSKSDAMKDTWKVASLYHLVHSCALYASAVGLVGQRKRNIVCSLLTAGITLFCGSCYTVVLMDQRAPYSYPAPVGGTLLIAGWLSIAFLN